MKSHSRSIVLFVIVLVCVCSTRTMRAQERSDRFVDSLLAVMTLDEKVGQLQQYSPTGVDSTGIGKMNARDLAMLRKGSVGSFLSIVGSKVIRQLQEIAVGESRLHIPLLFGYDVIHGYRTTFPIPLAEASTWDPAAVELSARVAAAEASAAGIHWTFAPMVDIARDPRWGRIAEGSGEDPYLGSLMAAARVRGFQGSNLGAPDAILACAKHFAAYGGAEGGRDYNTVDISERTLREVYLPPFEAAVRAGAGTIMSSFNEIAGVPSTANAHLLTDILRKEWGFTGFVVSDWNSIDELVQHGIAATRREAARLAMKAGLDMDMASGVYGEHLIQLVENGLVSPASLDEAVRRVLGIKFRLGLFSDPYRGCSPERERATLLSPPHIAAARNVAQKSIVLLKNEAGLLPLRKDLRTIAVIGPLAENSSDPLGPWDALGDPRNVVTVMQGIKNAIPPATTLLYAKGCPVDSNDTRGIGEAVDAARRSDVVIMVVGESRRMSGEASSRSSLGLPGVQEELVEAVQATGKPVVVVLMNGRPLVLPWMADHVRAIVEAWFLGVQTGNAVADVLFGDVNPSGKLPVSFPRAVGQIPIYYNHKNTGRPASDTTRWTSKYLDLPSTPLFPFGFGLSYTKFSYANLSLSDSVVHTEGVRVRVDVKNTGSRSGDEIVQLYLQDEAASVTRPVMELKGFTRVSLKPGESKSIEFLLTHENLSMYNSAMQWTVEPGRFRVYVGPNSAEHLIGRFTVEAHQ